jgi:tRNA (Thr-GGU) A37 N-methylase
LLGIEGASLTIENVDVLSGTPLLDLKPYVPAFDEQQRVRTGWLENSGGRVKERTSDRRFHS